MSNQGLGMAQILTEQITDDPRTVKQLGLGVRPIGARAVEGRSRWIGYSKSSDSNDGSSLWTSATASLAFDG